MSGALSGGGPVVVGYRDATSDAAVQWGAAEAGRRGVPLRVIHAYCPDPISPLAWGVPLPLDDARDFGAMMRANARSILEDALERVRTRWPELPVSSALVSVSPSASLVESSRHAALVVVGRAAERSMAHGSTALTVAAHAQAPLVMVPALAAEHASPVAQDDDRRPLGAGKVVVGVDDSPECAGALEFAFVQAAARGAPLVVVHATWWRPVSGPDPVPLAFDVSGTEPGRQDFLGLGHWMARYPQVKLTCALARLPVGDALAEISRGAELLVVGTRGHGGFSNLLLGSVSRDVLVHATCPVAVVRRVPSAGLEDIDVASHAQEQVTAS